jgi:phthalate 4,5-dioxygenase oxygenase subunit
VTPEENAILCGVGPGTPLHRPLSRYWYPVLRSEKLADRHTHKVRLLGEDFVIARRGAELIALEERCPHRQVSLVLARVEDSGLRCLYHGWLMDGDGTVKETPNEREVGGRERLKIRAPGVREAGGLIWLSTCTVESERAPFPDFPWMKLPSDHIVIVDVLQKTNWVQSVEGSIDSSHSTTLHQEEILGSAATRSSTVISEKGEAVQFGRPSSDKHPRISVRDTDFGFIYGALRKPLKDPEKSVYVRATAFAFPSFVTFPLSSDLKVLLVFVPIDETHARFLSIWYSMAAPVDRKGRIAWSGLDPETDLDEEGYLKRCDLPNWGQDREAIVAGRSFSGMRGINVQDTVVQESMGPVVDRTKEHLGPADLAIVHFRRMMLALARGEGPAADPGYAARMTYKGHAARDGLVAVEEDWTRLYAEGEVNWLAGPKVRETA